MNENINPRRKSALLKNWLTVTGAIISMGGLFAFTFLLFIDLAAHKANPYMGILAYVVAPGFILGGLLLSGLGAWIRFLKLRKLDPKGLVNGLAIDLSRPRDRKIAMVFGACGAFFLMLTAFGTYQTYHVSESVQFCGQVCHVPMKPEFTAYQAGAHARVECVGCHVGKGAEAYVKAKWNGVHQLAGVLSGDYPRPIPTPVRNLRPARETCEECHWPDKFTGDMDRTYAHYLADETNTFFAVRLSMKVGGSHAGHDGEPSIHWHVGKSNKVEYIAADPKRGTIPWVKFTAADGSVTEYTTKDFKGDLNHNETRTMDCLDCHNRPAHQFRSPNDAVDRAMLNGEIDPSIPWVKSNVVAAVIAPYATENEALEKISATLKSKYPKEAKIGNVITAATAIYKTNFFPEMKADWRSYPNYIGHKEWNGCFRCHDGLHVSKDGKKTIGGDKSCSSCHTIIAQGTKEDLNKVSPKGASFFHIDAVNEDFNCNNCHTGAFPKE